MTEQILSVVLSFKNNPLRSPGDRYKLAESIQSITSYYDLYEIVSFVEEMRGLNLKRQDDRNLFIQFLSSWLYMENNR